MRVNPTDALLINLDTGLEVIGTIAFALSGLIESARKRLDIVGMVFVAFLAAFGGGTLRDILLDRRPFFWVENQIWVWVIIAICILALVFMRSRHVEVTARATQWPDAVGLGIFAAGGTELALSIGVAPIIAVSMGVITAVFGGVLRDVMVNEIPRAFSDFQPYSVIAFFGGWIVVVLQLLQVESTLRVMIAAMLIIGFRMAAMVFNWRLPNWRP